MRPRTLWPDMPPPILTRFDPAHWPAADEREAFGLWCEARKTFEAQHAWPGGFLPMLLEQIAEQSRVSGGWGHLGPMVR